MIILPSQLEGVTSRKDRTIRLVFGTNELPPSVAGDLFSISSKFCYLAIKEDMFTDEEQKALEQLESNHEDGFKSKSQIMRNILFRMYEQDNKGFKTFTLFYDHHMEQLNNQLKTRLK